MREIERVYVGVAVCFPTSLSLKLELGNLRLSSDRTKTRVWHTARPHCARERRCEREQKCKQDGVVVVSLFSFFFATT